MMDIEIQCHWSMETNVYRITKLKHYNDNQTGTLQSTHPFCPGQIRTYLLFKYWTFYRNNIYSVHRIYCEERWKIQKDLALNSDLFYFSSLSVGCYFNKILTSPYNFVLLILLLFFLCVNMLYEKKFFFQFFGVLDYQFWIANTNHRRPEKIENI